MQPTTQTEQFALCTYISFPGMHSGLFLISVKEIFSILTVEYYLVCIRPDLSRWLVFNTY